MHDIPYSPHPNQGGRGKGVQGTVCSTVMGVTFTAFTTWQRVALKLHTDYVLISTL